MIPFELNKTHCGDNCQLIKQLPDACIDFTVTSPPYDDMDLDFNPLSKNGLRTYNGYAWDFKTLATELYRVTKPGGVCVWVVNDPTIDGSESLASSLQKIYFRRVGWNIHDTMIYKRENPPPLSHNRYEQGFEYVFVLSKNAPRVFNPIMKKSVMVGKKRGGTMRNGGKDDLQPKHTLGRYPAQSMRDNVFVYNVGNERDNKGVHPAIFPEALARDHITSWSNPGDLVCDPFSGSGTVAKMCRETGREFIGFEISQAYTDLANRRLAGAKVPLFDWTSA